MPPRLVAVEGLPGSGKTTAAGVIADLLRSRGITSRVVFEGDPCHPADFESVALLDPPTLARLTEAYPGCREELDRVSRRFEDGVLLGYGRLPGSTPEPLLDALRAREVYELPLDQHIRLRRRLWREFVAEAARLDVVHVFECCLIQNPVTVTALRDDAPEDVVHSFVAGLVDDAEELDPLVVYLGQDDVGACFARIARERPREWHDFFVGYYTGRGLGRAMGATGDAGTVQVLRRRAELEHRLLDRIGARVERVSVTALDPGATRAALAGILDRVYRPA